jgi:NAD(P)-dependent dehydrogenase (short-subunit alcohol dehydrogenase family)
MTRLSGKVAFVTGAGGGIGRAIALSLAQEGAKVTVADIKPDLIQETLELGSGLELTGVECDVSDRDAVFAAVDATARRDGGLDILVNNAVRFHYGPLADFPPDIASSMLDIGVKGVYWCLQAATPHLIARGGGSVINLSSIAVSMAIPNAAVYSSIKGAIDTLTRQQAAELGGHGIRVNALAPGSVRTPGASAVIDEKGWESRTAKTLLHRLPTPEEIGAAAVYLASDDAKSVTGVTLKIDAGMTVAGP